MTLFYRAFEEKDIEEFIRLMFPPAWAGVGARILESGVEFADDQCLWAPRWSRIPRTVRKGANDYETAIKSCIFRVHDCLHQLWGLPLPGAEFSEDDFYLFKRASMCGEVAVLTLTEFVFCDYLYDTFESTNDLIWQRNAVPMLRGGPLTGKTTAQVAMRLDGLLHKQFLQKWVRDDPDAKAFCDHYIPMLEDDRRSTDLHWEAMRRANWIPPDAPNSRYSPDLDGLELTLWMINDFYHLMNTDAKIDRALREFNRDRRRALTLPDGWDG